MSSDRVIVCCNCCGAEVKAPQQYKFRYLPNYVFCGERCQAKGLARTR